MSNETKLKICRKEKEEEYFSVFLKGGSVFERLLDYYEMELDKYDTL